MMICGDGQMGLVGGSCHAENEKKKTLKAKMILKCTPRGRQGNRATGSDEHGDIISCMTYDNA